MMSFLILGQNRYQAAIAGIVRDAVTLVAVPGAQVQITAMPAAFQKILSALALQAGPGWSALTRRADLTQTTKDGSFSFGDVPSGQYTLTITGPGGGRFYGNATYTVTVTHATDGTVTPTIATIPLPPTAVRGQVQLYVPAASSKPATTLPLPMARVRVRQSGERAHANQTGQFYLTGAEPGLRTLEITAPGYLAGSVNVSIQTGVVAIATTVSLFPAS
jgi:hypothetical protein